MVALERSLAQDTPAICGTTAKKKRASSQHIGARLIASTDSRRPKKEGGTRDRAGSRRHEAAKGLSAARQHFCERVTLGSIEYRQALAGDIAEFW